MENFNVRLMQQVVFSIVVLAFFYSPYSVVYAKRGLDKCFKKNELGEQITIPCLVGYQPMSDAEIQKSIDQFIEFEQSDTKEQIHQEAKKRAARLKKNPIPQHPAKRKITEQDIIKNEGLSYEERKQKLLDEGDKGLESVKAWWKMREAEAHLDPEIQRKMYYIKDDLYSVKVFFINDSDFPEKYTNYEVFIENTTAEYANDWKKIIFTRYLGEEYGRYKPEIGVVNELVSIKFYVKDSKELERILHGKPIYSVKHIGTPFTPEPPGSEYGVPPAKIKQ